MALFCAKKLGLQRIAIALCCLIAVLIPITASSARSSQDLWADLRQQFQLSAYAKHPEVNREIKVLMKSQSHLSQLAKQSAPYLYYVLQEVKKQNMPGEIALLPMIESAYDPFAYSHAGAAGLWQLMPGTGTGLGVKQNWWYDGRRDIHSSTKAALNYLNYLHNFFNGNWMLAIAAYDSGEGTVRQAVNKNAKAGQSTDFWALRLPKETKMYIPRLLALASVISQPHAYGLQLPSIPNKPFFVKIELESQIDLTQAAKLANLPYTKLIKLNPGYNRWATDPNGPHTLVLPIDNVATFQRNLSQIPLEKHVTWTRHVVTEGQSLSGIALKYHSSIGLIKRVNKLKNDLIHIGQILLIPKTKKLPHTAIVETQRRQLINKSKKIGPQKVIHIVQPGESYSQIAAKYHIRPAAIRFWNQLKYNHVLQQGEKLILWTKKPKGLTQYKTYRVKKGDNITKIAHKFHVSIAQLKSWNPQLKTSAYLQINQKLRIYSARA